LTEAGRGRALPRLLFALVFLQASIGLYQHRVFFEEMFRFRSRLPEAHAPGAGRSALLVLAFVALSALWAAASRGKRPASERFAVAGLAQIALLGLAHLAVAVADSGRLHAGLTFPLLATSAALAVVFLARRGPRAAAEPEARLTWWDAASALFLSTLFVPSVFAYIHYDAKVIWACRAFGFANQGSLAAVAACRCPNYPPLYSILLWLGVTDPLFQGRLLPWLALVFFVLLLRTRATLLLGRWAPMAILFFVSTVHVWQGAAMYYANVPLMVFLCGGALLAWGTPIGEAGVGEKAMGALLLGAAVLVRPDGLYYLGVLVAAALLLRVAGGRSVPVAPLLAGGAFAALWALRPAALREPSDFFSAATGGWHAAGASALGAALKTILVFSNGLQGQWLAHKGFGTAMFLLAGAFVVRARRGRDEGREDGDLALFGLVTLGNLAAVAACYLAIAFVGDVWDAAQPFSGTWIEAYLHWVRVGLGRMTVHLYPFAVLYGAGAFAEAGRRLEARG
jgi:hypothetical protein